MVLFIFASFTTASPGRSGENGYLEDWQSTDGPNDPSKIVTIPRYPEQGRKFEIRRIYLTENLDRKKLQTPREGYIETLKVSNGNGILEFWRDNKLIHTITLGECFSFAKMDEHHNFARQGSPAYFTAPPDCTVWDGREWHQTYKSLVGGWEKPCVYEAKRQAKILAAGNGKNFISISNLHLTMEKNGKTYNWSNYVEFDGDLQFFAMFDVGYLGRVEVLREIVD